jgi:hypothetical protein
LLFLEVKVLSHTFMTFAFGYATFAFGYATQRQKAKAKGHSLKTPVGTPMFYLRSAEWGL